MVKTLKDTIGLINSPTGWYNEFFDIRTSEQQAASYAIEATRDNQVAKDSLIEEIEAHLMVLVDNGAEFCFNTALDIALSGEV